MLRNYDVHTHLCRTLGDAIKIVHLEPQQNAVPVWLVLWITYRSMMMPYLEAV